MFLKKIITLAFFLNTIAFPIAEIISVTYFELCKSASGYLRLIILICENHVKTKRKIL